ncbi:MAG: small, acid-soluble spore protein, alpha/beta type [Clostridiales bacterium]|nr:small, acid-soluble spore protein, alpha/beta type [Clostridiales bacterium]
MSKKAKPKKKEKPVDPVKMEIAEELGLLDKVKEYGWGGLSAKETGKIGGLMARRKQLERKKTQQE